MLVGQLDARPGAVKRVAAASETAREMVQVVGCEVGMAAAVMDLRIRGWCCLAKA
jgi:hypothetical protein